MIDRRTALASAALIALMLLAAGWRVAMLDEWSTLAFGEAAALPSLVLFVFPASCALVVPYWCMWRMAAIAYWFTTVGPYEYSKGASGAVEP